MKQEYLAAYNRETHAMDVERQRIQDVDKRMAKHLSDEKLQFVDAEEQLAKTDTFGKRVADKVAAFGGSWPFVIGFMVFIIGWMFINVAMFFGIHFDPYPFILLNLALSCISAIQAPVIMMSQNRAGEKDNITRDNDFKTNQRSEIQLKLLHSKLDHIMLYQHHQRNLTELNIKMNDEILTKVDSLSKKK